MRLLIKLKSISIAQSALYWIGVKIVMDIFPRSRNSILECFKLDETKFEKFKYWFY